MSTVRVNGSPVEVDADETVAGLLRRMGVTAPRVAVEVNREVVPAARHAAHRLRDGDRIEIVQFVGGGA
jgi:sulfur carrier protein